MKGEMTLNLTTSRVQHPEIQLTGSQLRVGKAPPVKPVAGTVSALPPKEGEMDKSAARTSPADVRLVRVCDCCSQHICTLGSKMQWEERHCPGAAEGHSTESHSCCQTPCKNQGQRLRLA